MYTKRVCMGTKVGRHKCVSHHFSTCVCALYNHITSNIPHNTARSPITISSENLNKT